MSTSAKDDNGMKNVDKQEDEDEDEVVDSLIAMKDKTEKVMEDEEENYQTYKLEKQDTEPETPHQLSLLESKEHENIQALNINLRRATEIVHF